MRIFVEPGDAELSNMGDISMLQIAVERLQQLCPQAFIQVLTDAPEHLTTLYPGVTPIPAKGQRIWASAQVFPEQYIPILPPFVQSWLRGLQTDRCRRPRLFRELFKWRYKLFQSQSERSQFPVQDIESLNAFLEAVLNANLILVTGMGGITDAFPAFAYEVMEILKLAHQQGIPIALMGQGIGPLQDLTLRAQAQQALPLAQIIALREERASLPLLISCGVAKERIIVTGDDAIELAYRLPDAPLGNGLGINLRNAPSIYSHYSGITPQLLEELRLTLQAIASAQAIPLIPLPISRAPANDDAETIQYLLRGYPPSNGQTKGEVESGAHLYTPLQVIEQIQRCRVVITGSYHAGVFALALGIPVVALAKSAYYIDKFLGLAQQFGLGCEVLLLDNPNWSAELRAAFERTWSSAEDVRPLLRDAALKQIKSGYIAYQHVIETYGNSSL